MRFLFLSTALVICSFALGQSFATVRVMESSLKKLSFMQIAYENGESENLPLEDWSFMSTGSATAATMSRNQAATNKMLSDMEKKGYALLTTSMSTTDAYLMTLFVFRKRD